MKEMKTAPCQLLTISVTELNHGIMAGVAGFLHEAGVFLFASIIVDFWECDVKKLAGATNPLCSCGIPHTLKLGPLGILFVAE